MQIRPYLLSDQEPLVQLWLASTVQGQPFISQEFWESQAPLIREQYLPHAETWVAEEEGKVLGFISLLDTLIGALFVLPEAQGKGVGTALIQYAQEIKQAPLQVEVYQANSKAHAFYTRYGFQYVSEFMQPETGKSVLALTL